MRSLSLAFFACHAPPPNEVEQPLLVPEAGEELDVLHRQVETVPACILQKDALVRGAKRGEAP